MPTLSRLSPIIALALALAATPGASAQDLDARYDAALAAGYKAQFLCSGLWNGHKTEAAIMRDELSGIYDRVAAGVAAMPAEIDAERHQVRVRFADGMPPRVAQWRAGLGCASLPIGAAPQSAQTLPALQTAFATATFDDRCWPMGDVGAATKPLRGDAALRTAVDDAITGKFGGTTSAVVIVRGGKIVAERYREGFDRHTSQRTWSVAKSLAGTLIGHAVARGLVTTDAPAGLSEWSGKGDPRGTITLDGLMRMASGLYSDSAGNRTDPVYMGGTAVMQRATQWPLLRAPGSAFRYANNDSMLAYLATQRRLPENERLSFPIAFFRKLGMTRTIAETDWQGSFILSSQVWTTSRDLARLGMLYLADGKWQDEQLLPVGWARYVATPSGPQPADGFGYGATFWLIDKEAGIPADTYVALGNRGQIVVIVPSRDMVIVRRGYDTAEERIDTAAFVRAVLAR